MTTIPASDIVQVNPSVIGAGGAGLDLVGLVLTTSIRPPIGSVPSFPSAAAVASYFGAGSSQAALASVYFAGFDGSAQTPGALLFAQYPIAPVSAYLRGGNISALALATLQSYNGTLNVTIDGVLKTAAINLSAASSFSNAAEIIAQALGIEGVQAATLTGSIGGTFTCTSAGAVLTVSAVLTGSLQQGDHVSGNDGTNALPGGCTILSQLTGTPGGTGTYQLSGAATPGNLGSCTVTSASTKLNVTAVATGAIGVADVLVGTSIPANTYVASQVSGAAGGVGIYSISGSPITVSSEAITAFTPAVQYDSVSGAFLVISGTTGTGSTITFGSGALAPLLLLTSATGAVLSQGAAAATPAAFMAGVVAVTTNWASFMTEFDPDAGSGNAQKQLFAAWKSAQNNRYLYACWDTDASPTTQLPAAASLGQILKANGDSGTALVWEPSNLQMAAFVCGAVASIDFEQTNGRTTMAFRWQAGLTAGVTTESVALNLLGNGYNFGGAYAAANAGFVWFQNGQVTGAYAWIDSYVNQIWLNNQFQIALLTLMQNAKSIPYNAAGSSLIEAALADPISAGLNFGAFAPGAISASQQASVNQQAGSNISNALQTQGYYLQVLQASSVVRAARGSPPCTFWYLDRGSVQKITLSSVAVQ